MRDLYAGERAIKSKGEKYLPATSGMRLDGMLPSQLGYKDYEAYKERAVLHEYVSEAVSNYIGHLHVKDAQFKLPKKMEYMLTEATFLGEGLQTLLRRINSHQLLAGRLGLMADLPSEMSFDSLPKLSVYAAESIVNWDDNAFSQRLNSLNLVVINESAPRRVSGFRWEVVQRYRILQLGDLDLNEDLAIYRQGVFEDRDYNFSEMFVPTYKGQALEAIPFVFINAKDTLSDFSHPPLQGLGKLTLAIYRGEADYRQNLHMQSQDTLVTVGGIRNPGGIAGVDSDAVRIGAGSRLDIELGGDAKFIGVSSTGLSEQRLSLENDKALASIRAGNFIGGGSSRQESGEAISVRLAAQMALLRDIAMTGAAGLEKILKIVATWMGENPEEVSVLPNLEFTKIELRGQDVLNLVQAQQLGAPLSNQSLHAMMADRGMTVMDFESEMAIVKKAGVKQDDNQNRIEQP